jgi:hypothetical protein
MLKKLALTAAVGLDVHSQRRLLHRSWKGDEEV